MSIFYHNDDPLLFQRPTVIDGQQVNTNNINDTYAQLYRQQLMQQASNQQQYQTQDWLNDLDNAMKNLDSASTEALGENLEFTELNAQLQNMVQSEIMSLVKVRLNTQPNAVDNIKKQLDIIKNVKFQVQENERKNMNELNDYMKNYSHLTFNEYRKLKNGDDNTTNIDNNKPTKTKNNTK